jgi:hypothetical protein
LGLNRLGIPKSGRLSFKMLVRAEAGIRWHDPILLIYASARPQSNDDAHNWNSTANKDQGVHYLARHRCPGFRDLLE